MKVLITGAFQFSEEQWQELEKLNIEIEYMQDEKSKIDFEANEIEYIICNGFFLYHNIQQFKNLKYIQVTSAGLDRLPMEYIKQNGIQVFNARGVYSIPIAEWTILKILEIYKKSKVFYMQQENRTWEKQRDIIELNGKKACIIGYGSIGVEIAKRLKAFNVGIDVIDTKKIEDDNINNYYRIESIDEVIKNNDIIILSLPLTPETENIINKSKLELMRQDAILVNISRGKIINEEDLIEQLDNKKFRGVILDVFQEEPLSSNSKLWDYKNTIITPHNCFVSDKNNERMFRGNKEKFGGDFTMKKVLLVATVQSHIAQFHRPLINMLKEKGYIIDIAAKDNLKEKNGLKIEGADNIYDIKFSRNPFDKNNILAYKKLKKIILEKEYDIIHCNTPVGGILTRLIKKNSKIKSKIIYTAHGFHFYKGGPIKNWIIYYPIEKYFSRYTQALITINDEDYQIAKNKFKSKLVYKINSTGINVEKFTFEMLDTEKNELRRKLNIENNDFVIICVGELNKNKNQIMQIMALKSLVLKNKNIKWLFLGNGPLKEFYSELIMKKGLENNACLLGYKTDVDKILHIGDCLVSTSKREGLGINIIEAMAAGLPVIATSNRGHREIITNEFNGILVKIGNDKELSYYIQEMIDNKDKRMMIANEGKKSISRFSEKLVMEELKKIYNEVVNDTL